ncbi:MAG: 50S ribosomal protein L15 [Spirochaetes bacterium GWF1_31_7]|nr:MAG: 50S ribosomal protein L15 [Spirochaetes bacterium GWE1_32_154]OHD47303.1 MAG: 50S ribosomal protein L15 [Spirochaetes bacterium GWE2_31_10]OHD47362.1 MAG: 50S ribosomal protein L15 [Spirochaetes bacterium GWF1_31_7]HBD92815.1 50S ribosomal protein L15 [Spirochaetia bacterium]HBI37322.1 50S ribosomal protein L15 [Spirochaetia bacterium]
MKNLRPPVGAVKKKKIVGRGPGSGIGKTSGRGMNGQNSRSGGGVRPGFEGGQTPLVRRLPKRGFKNSLFTTIYNVINICDLEKFENVTVFNLEKYNEFHLIKKSKLGLKILGFGNLTKKLEIHANAFSKSAIDKIEKAGGKIVIIK